MVTAGRKGRNRGRNAEGTQRRRVRDEGVIASEPLNPDTAMERKEVVNRISAFGGQVGSRLFTAAKSQFGSPDSKRVVAAVTDGGGSNEKAGHT